MPRDTPRMGKPKVKTENLAALPLVVPFVIIYLTLFIYPTLQMLAMSFTDSALTTTGGWVGFENYEKLLRDRNFWASVLNTAYFVALTVVPGTLIGLGLAMVVNQLKGGWQAVALAAFFIPYILPVSTVTTIAFGLTNIDGGPLGGFAYSRNGTLIPVWRNATLFMPAVAVLTIWWTVGFSVLVFLAGLRALPHEIYEAAKIDGAGRWARFRNLTWPLIWPITTLVLTLQLILQIRVFDQVYLMASQGRSRSTMVLVQYIYSVAFQQNQAGYASTVAVAMFVIVGGTVALMFQLRRLRGAR